MPLTTDQKKAELHAAIDSLPAKSVDLLMSVVAEFATSRQPVKAVFLTRAIQALITLVEEAPVEAATAAASDYDLFLKLLQQPEVMQALPSQDPLAAAKLRGLLAKPQLLEAEGGCLSSQEAATVLGITRQAVDKRRGKGRLIGLPVGRVYVYPAWQFTPGKTLSGLEQVLQVLQVQDPWMQTVWMVNGNHRLAGRSPLEVLRQGNLDAVLEAAQLYGI